MMANRLSTAGDMAQTGLLILDLTASTLGAGELRDRLRCDSVLAHNPAGALHTAGFYYKRILDPEKYPKLERTLK